MDIELRGWVGETIVYYIYNHSLLASIWWEGAEGVGGWMWVWVTLVRGRWELIPPTKTAPVGLVWSVRSSLESCTSLHDEFITARPCWTSSSSSGFSSYKRGILGHPI